MFHRTGCCARVPPPMSKTISICVVLLGPAIAGCGEVTQDAPPVDGSMSPPDGMEPTTCVDAPAGLTAWWRAESSAADALDRWHGAMHGNPGYTPAVVGNGFALDGDDYVTVEHSGDLYPVGSFAIEAWIDPGTVASGKTVLSMYEGGDRFDGDSAISLKVTAARQVDLWTRVSAEGQTLITAAALAPGVRHHVVAMRNSEEGSLELYIDGVREGVAALLPGATGAFTAGTLDQDPLVIGASTRTNNPVPHEHFVGVIDELSYYKAALSAQQVAALHAAGARGKCAP